MKEQDYFALMEQLRDEQIAEAVTWKQRADAAQEPLPAEQKSAGQAPASLGEFFGTEPAKPVQTKETTYTSGSSREEMSPKQLRQMGFGVTAIAACLMLTVGGLAWKTHREQAGVPGASVTQSSDTGSSIVAVQTDSAGNTEQTTTALTTGEDIAVQTVTTYDNDFRVFAPTDTYAQFKEPVITYVERYVEPEQPQPNNEPNFLGGTGPLRPISEGVLEYTGMIEDNDYYYYANYRLSKATGEQTRRCIDPECEHRSNACIEESYQASSLISDGEQIYYNNNSAGRTLFTIEQDGTLKRFLCLEETPDGNPIDAQTVFFDTVKKVDDGIYYISGSYNEQSDQVTGFHTSVNYRLIYTPDTGKIIWLPMRYTFDQPVYSPERGSFFVTNRSFFSESGDKTEPDTFYEYDIHTGKLLRTIELPLRQQVLCWDVWQGMIYYTETQDNYVTTDFSRVDPDTGETELLKQDCDYGGFQIVGDDMFWVDAMQDNGKSSFFRGRMNTSEAEQLTEPADIAMVSITDDTLAYMTTSFEYVSSSREVSMQCHFRRLDTGEEIVFNDEERAKQWNDAQ